MAVFYLTFIIFNGALGNVLTKSVLRKTDGRGQFFFGFLKTVCAMLIYAVTCKSFIFSWELALYALLFAVAYIFAVVFMHLAVGCGPLSLTSLLISYHLIIPAFFGLFFLKDPLGFGLIPGLLLLIVSFFLSNYQKGEKTPITFKWIVYVLLAFLGNGMGAIVLKLQQVRFEGTCRNELMLLSMAIASIPLLLFALHKERKDIPAVTRAAWLPALLGGGVNGVAALLELALFGLMPLSIYYPTKAAGGIVVTYIAARLLYKEKLSRVQFAGFLIGIVSIVLLNI